MTNGQAQNKLGQLFVDIGVGGLGQTLKALNSVSATFLLTKNAATQAIKPFVDMGVKAANSAVGIGKMAAALATTSLNAQRLKYYLNKFDANGLEGDIASLQQIFTKARKGLGGFSGEFSTSYSMIGMKKNLQAYSGSFEDTLQFIQDVKNALKTSGMSEEEKVMHLQNLGLGQWKYLFEKDDFDLNKSLNISDKTIKDAQKAEEDIERLKNSFEQGKMKLVGRLLDGGLLNKLDKLADVADKYIDGDEATRTDVNNKLIGTGAVVGGAAVGGAPGATAAGLAVFGASQYSKNAQSIGGHNYTPIGGGQLDFAVNPFNFIPNKTVVNLTNKISGNNVQFEELTAEEENALTGGRKVEVNAYTTHNGHDL